MSREIKFRTWVKQEEWMWYSDSQKSDDRIYFLIINSSGPYLSPIHHEEYEEYTEFELMQYTGLTDRNKTPIYEGDIVKQTYHTQAGSVHDGTDITFDGHHIGPVVITARGVCLKNPLHYSEDTDETHPMNAYKQVAGYRSEVIGNVFQHPHLLKE